MSDTICETRATLVWLITITSCWKNPVTHMHHLIMDLATDEDQRLITRRFPHVNMCQTSLQSAHITIQLIIKSCKTELKWNDWNGLLNVVRCCQLWKIQNGVSKKNNLWLKTTTNNEEHCNFFLTNINNHTFVCVFVCLSHLFLSCSPATYTHACSDCLHIHSIPHWSDILVWGGGQG